MAVRRIDAGLVTIAGASVPVEVRVNPRARRLILRLGRERMITVTCPSSRHVPAALDMVKTQQNWIADQMATTPSSVPLILGARFTVNGTPVEITPAANPRSAARFVDGFIVVGGDTDDAISRRVETLLRKTVRERCNEQAVEMARTLGVTLGRISVKQMTTRWGSCSVDGSLSFNWRLVFAPKAVLTYVIAHEVAHRVEMNHSRAFWAIVQKLDPDYHAAASWLRNHGASLHAYGGRLSN